MTVPQVDFCLEPEVEPEVEMMDFDDDAHAEVASTQPESLPESEPAPQSKKRARVDVAGPSTRNKKSRADPSLEPENEPPLQPASPKKLLPTKEKADKRRATRPKGKTQAVEHDE
jgi:hypothetical protein